jgi:hypothetical protein
MNEGICDFWGWAGVVFLNASINGVRRSVALWNCSVVFASYQRKCMEKHQACCLNVLRQSQHLVAVLRSASTGQPSCSLTWSNVGDLRQPMLRKKSSKL